VVTGRSKAERRQRKFLSHGLPALFQLVPLWNALKIYSKKCIYF